MAGYIEKRLYEGETLRYRGQFHWLEHAKAWLMLIVFGTVTFGSAQIGYKIMSMGDEDDDQSGGKRDALPVADPVAIPVRVTDH